MINKVVVLSAADQFRTTSNSLLHMRMDKVNGAFVDQWSNSCCRICGISHGKGKCAISKLFSEFIRDLLFYDDTFGGHANLSLMQECIPCCGIDRVIKIRITQDDKRILASHFKF